MKLKLLSMVTGALVSSTMLFGSVAQADITIGFIGPVTGPVAAYGIDARNGAEAAVAAINAQGGINGENIEFKVYDDAADARQAVSAANQLIGDGVLYVVGPITSNSTMPVSDMLFDNGILMVTPSATTSELTDRDMWNVFRTIGRDDQQALYAADYIATNLGDKNIGILHDRATYGAGLAAAFKQAINERGIEEVYSGTINPGEKDYSAALTRMKADNVEVLYYGGYHPEAGLLARQAQEIGLDFIMVGADGFNNSELWAIAGAAAEGTLLTNPLDAKSNPDAQEAIKAMQANNIPVGTFAMNAYAAVQVLANGIEQAGDPEDPEAVAEALKNSDGIQTVLGDITFDENGDLASKTFAMFKWHDGGLVPAETADAAETTDAE